MPQHTPEAQKENQPKSFLNKIISSVDNLMRPSLGSGTASKAKKDLAGRAQKLKDQEKALGI